MTPRAAPAPSWLQRANAWIRHVNHLRLARRKARKQRKIDRRWFAADDPHLAHVAAALQRRLAACGELPKFTLLLWPAAADRSAPGEALRAIGQSMNPHWELLLPDDTPVDSGMLSQVRTYDARGAIGSALVDLALQSATGSYVALIPGDWIMAPHALVLAAEAAVRHPQARLIYGDDDCLGANGRRHGHRLRCDWNQELLRSTPYIDGVVFVRRDAWVAARQAEPADSRAAWWSLLLRLTEGLQEAQVLHIPHVLGHRIGSAAPAREPPPPTVEELAAVQAHLDRSSPGATAQRAAEGGVHVRYPVPAPPPLVSLVIPTRNGLELLRQCVGSIVDKTAYPNYEIVVVDNGSDDAAALDYLQGLHRDPRIRVHRDDRPFNFSALNNAAARICRGELLGLVNNDIEVIGGGWLDEMVGLASRPDVGAVGARLWFSNDTLQHAGVVLGIGGVAGHVHHKRPRSDPGYQGRARLTQEFSAVTAACMVLRRSVFDEMGGLDEAHLAVDYNDIDFCLRIRRAGYRVVWTPHAELYHHESATRGANRSDAARRRYESEVAFMRTNWSPLLEYDPAYNPQLTLRHLDFSISESPRVTLSEPWFESMRGRQLPPPVAAAARPAAGAP